MRIAMVSNYLPSESKIGSGYQAHYMANAFSRRGHEVVMFSLCSPCPDALYQTTTLAPRGRLRTFRFAWALRGVDYASFDVLHAHGDDYWIWSRKPRCHVRTMHGSCLAEALHISGLTQKVRMLALGLTEVLATLVADRTVCVSENTRTWYPWLRDVIANGVDTSVFHPGAALAADPTILFVGTYGKRKRGHLLMEAFARVVRQQIPTARLWMVCQDAPAASGVEVLGTVPLPRLAELYRQATVFCLPSSYEGFGVPYIEAMASGTPVVATPNVGAQEVLDGGRYGVLAKPAELGDALVRLLSDAVERQRLSTLGLARSQMYAWDSVIDRYENLYRAVLSAR